MSEDLVSFYCPDRMPLICYGQSMIGVARIARARIEILTHYPVDSLSDFSNHFTSLLLLKQQLPLITTMADPFANQHAMYDAQYEAIGALFDPGDGVKVDFGSLAQRLREALSDPALPLYYRAEDHIMNAWCVHGSELQLEWARESLDDIVQVLQAGGSRKSKSMRTD